MNVENVVEQINGRFSPTFGWPEGFIKARVTAEGGFSLRIGWSDVQFRANGSSVGGGTDMETFKMCGVLDEAFKLATRQSVDCSRLVHTPPDSQTADQILHFDEPAGSRSGGHGRE